MVSLSTFCGYKKLALSVGHSKFIIQTAMNIRHRFTDKQRHLAIAHHRIGDRQSDVARELGASQSVNKLESRPRTAGRVYDRPRCRAPQVSDHNNDQYLRPYQTSLCNWHTAASSLIKFEWYYGFQTNYSKPTLRLLRFDLIARRPWQATQMTPSHRRERLQWAKDHAT